MKPTNPKGPKFKKLRINLKPEQGVAPLASGLSIPGYQFLEATRQGAEAVITFVRVNGSK